MLKLRCLALVGASLFATLVYAESGPTENASAGESTAATGTSTDDLATLRQRLAEQEAQIKMLQKAVAEQRTLLERAIQVTQANGPASGGNQINTVAVAHNSNSAPLTLAPAVNQGWNAAKVAGQNVQASKPSPISIPLGSATLTPLGFVDFTYYGRSTNVGSGVGTNFGGVPYNTSVAGHLSENNFTAQNSRIGFRVDSKVLGAKVLGYFEADFLGNQPGNLFVTSNADTFRMRNVFVDVQKGKWEFLGGQDWSMLTPNRKGLSPLPSDIFYTQNMDTNYQAGLVWSRQGQFRAVYHPGKDWALGVSLENPQQYIGGSGGLATAAVTLPTALATTLLPQFNNAANAVATGNSMTTGGGNYTTPNIHPDIVIKGAYDGHVGDNDKIYHVEAGALVRTFKDSIPLGSPTQFTSNSKTAMSGSVNANLEIFKNVKLIANTFFGQGGGRYVFGLAPDVVVRADGSISPVHTYSTVDGVEFNAGKNTLINAYYGGVYIGRQVALDANGKSPIGYGFAGSPNGDNKSIQEFTFGLTQTLWKSASWGALSLINQYSYLVRNPWAEAAGAPKSAHTNMYFIDLRYTIP